MQVDLLVVPDCPHEAAAGAALQEAAKQAGIPGPAVTVIVIAADDEAQRLGFVGSPTFLLDGVDPFASPGAATGVTCRVYSTTTGPSGIPEIAQLRDALVTACASRSSGSDGR